jgi:hypothetical protein
MTDIVNVLLLRGSERIDGTPFTISVATTEHMKLFLAGMSKTGEIGFKRLGVASRKDWSSGQSHCLLYRIDVPNEQNREASYLLFVNDWQGRP